MAKKKNAPVLRAQGEDPTPATPTITKSYAVRDKWLDKAKDNLVEFKSVDGEISDLMVNGQPAGGGGGGDLTTIDLEISNNTSQTKQLALPYIDENSANVGPIISLITLSAYSGDVYKIPIYKGLQKFNVGTGWTLDITGDAERTSTTVVEIWGNAVITIS